MRKLRIALFGALFLFFAFSIFGCSVSLLTEVFTLAKGGSILQNTTISPRTEAGQLISSILSTVLSIFLCRLSYIQFDRAVSKKGGANTSEE